jgi:hypothetical protein
MALISPAERSTLMRTRKSENSEERDERLKLETERKSELIAAEDNAVDRLIRENIRLYGA